MFKKLMSLLLVICILSSSVILSAAATNTTDYSRHQSAKVISKWDSKGLLSGLVANRKFKPDTPIKRAEFVYLINRTLNFTEKSSLTFSDVSAKAWYYSEISKAIAAGYIDGAGKVKFNPEAAIDKQTAVLYLYKAFKLEVKNKKAAEIYTDYSKISASCRDAVSAMVENGYIAATKGSSFNPANRLTRAQALELIDKLAGTIENKTGQYKGNVNGNVIVNTKDVALKDMIISGNLYLTEGIGSGNVRLENVKVKGQTIIRGGGENSINVINSTLIGNVLVNKKDGKVRIAAKGNTEIGNVILYSGTSLQESGITGKGFVNVLLQKIGAGQTVKLSGVFGSVTLQVPKSSLQLSEGSIEKLIIDNGSPDSSVTVSGNAVISSLTVFAKAKILGTGLIKSAEVVSDGVTFEKQPAEIIVKKGVKPEPSPITVPTPTPGANVPANLVANGDFELDPINGWKSYNNELALLGWDMYQSGGTYNHCMKIASDASVFATCHSSAAVKPDTIYTFSIKYKISKVVKTETDDMGFHIFVAQYDENNQPIPDSMMGHNSYSGTIENWTELTYEITSASNASAFDFQIGLSGTGTVWFDDVKLTEVGPKPVSTPAPGKLDNLVANGNYELNPINLNGWYAVNPIDHLKDTHFTWDTYQMDGSSTRCIKISADEVTHEICDSRTPIKPGTIYTFSLKYKLQNVSGCDSNTLGFNIYTSQFDKNAQSIDRSIIHHSFDGTTGGWVELTYEITSESNVDNLFIQIGLSGKGTVWFDDVKLIEKGPY